MKSINARRLNIIKVKYGSYIWYLIMQELVLVLGQNDNGRPYICTHTEMDQAVSRPCDFRKMKCQVQFDFAVLLQ